MSIQSNTKLLLAAYNEFNHVKTQSPPPAGVTLPDEELIPEVIMLVA
jgi:hypothetical protein